MGIFDGIRDRFDATGRAQQEGGNLTNEGAAELLMKVYCAWVINSQRGSQFFIDLLMDNPDEVGDAANEAGVTPEWVALCLWVVLRWDGFRDWWVANKTPCAGELAADILIYGAVPLPNPADFIESDPAIDGPIAGAPSEPDVTERPPETSADVDGPGDTTTPAQSSGGTAAVLLTLLTSVGLPVAFSWWRSR